MEVDRDFLGSALTNYTGERVYFNRETGEVIPDLDFGTEWDEDRFIEIRPLPSYEGHDLRVEFSESIEDPALRTRLRDALRGKGAFRRFLDIVRDIPDVEARWFATEGAWLDQKVSEWLEENGVTVA